MGSRTFDFSREIAIIGIVNVTPDSFSDGGRFASAEDAVEWALQLVEEGADLLDIGGESSRPGAAPITADEEIARVLPVIRGIRRTHPAVPLSIDTTKSVVAAAALAAGVDGVNDISAGVQDPAMFDVVARAAVPMVLMHMRGTPATMQHNPTYDDCVTEVIDALTQRIVAAEAAGIARSRLIVDPGIGFGKSVDHNVRLIRALAALQALDCPICIGTSRKSFIGALLGGSGVTERLEGSLATIAAAVTNGARLVRVHDVAATRRFLKVLCVFYGNASAG